MCEIYACSNLVSLRSHQSDLHAHAKVEVDIERGFDVTEWGQPARNFSTFQLSLSFPASKIGFVFCVFLESINCYALKSLTGFSNNLYVD